MRYLFILLCILTQSVFATETPQTPTTMPAMTLEQTIVKMPLADGVDMNAAIESMKLRANSLNMKLVAHQPMWKEFEAQGYKKVRRVEIFQFCNIDVAHDMLDFNIGFVAYMPCRIAAIEDDNGKAWLIMMNLDLLMSFSKLSPELLTKAQKVRDDLMNIMQAGANGEL
ncbi:DUF302 domain-containing protein [Beggiatoa leptomitoformis]|uniref:DUF302 domain-containing protein n=1 Tax=Beggiatoa leptomitoformis TaxID=288004 RepID=A0A2N9YBJ8_9GAMM|nr:DUF302 domain-containing protein [Beggiatoa leptomitoformis]ALG66807.1 DUF302 domain-containing protein [Beggiatoa leptomitoformis]AUI67845.1 DUF302 domain-containing protein [Beggiatoa leptomitoformis]